VTTRGYNVVRATLNGITHTALQWMNSSVIASCGQPCGLAEIYEIGMGIAGVPAVDCMSCLVAKARTWQP